MQQGTYLREHQCGSCLTDGLRPAIRQSRDRPRRRLARRRGTAGAPAFPQSRRMRLFPASRSTRVSHARAGETRSRAQTEDSMGDRGHAVGDRAVQWSLRGHRCRPSRMIASYPSEASRRSMNARGVRISISPMFASSVVPITCCPAHGRAVFTRARSRCWTSVGSPIGSLPRVRWFRLQRSAQRSWT
jgi:hypothetical protein